MGNLYRIKLMPSVEKAYQDLRVKVQISPTSPPSLSRPEDPAIESAAQHLFRVNQILRSLANPLDIALDQSLLARIGWLLTRNIESTILYYLRFEETRTVSVLHITEFDNTNSYARFCEFLGSGGVEILTTLGVHPPIGNIGSSASFQ